MKVKYNGKSFGVDGMTSGETYNVICVDEITGMLRIIDDSGDDYLYNPKRPKPNGAKEAYGNFEIVEDDKVGSLEKAIFGR